MSDLLPLVCATLRDRVLLETQEELVRLRQREAIAQSVEIVHIPSSDEEDNDRGERRWERRFRDEDRPFTVIASGSIVEGKYDEFGNAWVVSLTQMNPCPLADLKDCRILVCGACYCNMLIPPRQGHEVLAEPDDLDTRSSKYIYFNDATQVQMDFLVHNWPTWRQERDSWYLSSELTGGVAYLSDTVARQHPGATIEFLSVSLDRSDMHVTMQRLIPRDKLMEARKLAIANKRDNPPPQQSDPVLEKLLEELEVDGNDPAIASAIAWAIGRYRRLATPEQQTDPIHLQELLKYLLAMEENVLSIFTPIAQGFGIPDQIYVERVVLSYLDNSLEDFQSTIMGQLMSDRVHYLLDEERRERSYG